MAADRRDRTAAQRQRRRRQRKAGDKGALQVDYPSGIEAALDALGYTIDPSEVGYEGPLRRALEDALEDLVELGELRRPSHRD